MRRRACMPAALSLAALLAVVCLVVSPGAHAQTGHGLRATSTILTADYQALRSVDPAAQPTLPDLGTAPTPASRASFAYGSVIDLNSLVQVEMPRDLGDGRYSRPKVRLGMQSESLKSLAQSMGLQPDRCTLPGLRARSSASSDELSASVMVFARCSFF